MFPKIKKAKISKRTSYKSAFKKFIESDYKDKQTFLSACKNNENLMIYACLTEKELEEIFEKLRAFDKPEDINDYLINNQPIMNSDPERFDRCCASLVAYLKGYIEYNSFRLANRSGDSNDWASEFYLKYVKICNFYRTRWFFPETLDKPSSVQYNPMLYKEFLYVVRLSISGDRRHKAFLATQDEESSIFKLSIDSKVEDNKGEKSIADVIPDSDCDPEQTLSQVNINVIINKALEILKKYPDAAKYYDKIKEFYEKQDPMGFDKKVLLLGKIFLYRAGLVSPKIIAFIKALSPTYKTRYHISQYRLTAQANELKKIKTGKSIKKFKNTDLTYKDYIFRKRGELEYDLDEEN